MNPHPASGVVCECCNPATDKLALALAAQAWPEAERPAHWQSLQELIRKAPHNVVLLACRDHDQLGAALMAQLLVGKTAVIWPPQFANPHERQSQTLAESLFTRVARELSTRGVHLAQALIPPGHDAASALLSHGGFSHAADLLYLAAPSNCYPEHALELPFSLEPFYPAAADRLATLIDRTYKGTLDCPRLDGLRETSDVILGYQAVGDFRPELWQLVRSAGEDIGCLLINLHPHVKQAEIVYAALVPEVRGRGWGLELTRHAQWLARVHQCEQVVLAVDGANAPAIRMYAAAGFSQWDQKSVWLRALR